MDFGDELGDMDDTDTDQRTETTAETRGCSTPSPTESKTLLDPKPHPRVITRLTKGSDKHGQQFRRAVINAQLYFSKFTKHPVEATAAASKRGDTHKRRGRQNGPVLRASGDKRVSLFHYDQL